MADARDNGVSSRIFKGSDDIVAQYRTAWNKLLDQTWKILSIGPYDRVHWS